MVPMKKASVKARGDKPVKALKPLVAVFKDRGFFVKSADRSSGSFIALDLEFGEDKPRLRAGVTLYPNNRMSIEHLNVDPRNFFTSVVEDEVSKVPLVNEWPAGAFPVDQLVSSLSNSQKLCQHNMSVVKKAMDEAIERAAQTKLDMLKALVMAVKDIEEFALKV